MSDNDLVELCELFADLAVAVIEEGKWTLFTTLRKRGGRLHMNDGLCGDCTVQYHRRLERRALWDVRS